jgi:hypothetical protein
MITRIQWDYIATIRLPLILLIVPFNMIDLNTLKLIDTYQGKTTCMIDLYTFCEDHGITCGYFDKNECPIAFFIQHYASWACETSFPQLKRECWRRKLTAE